MARRGPMKPIMPGIGDDVARAVIGGRYTPAGLPGTIAIARWPHVARLVKDMTVAAAIVAPGVGPVLAIVAAVFSQLPPVLAQFATILEGLPPIAPTHVALHLTPALMRSEEHTSELQSLMT